MSAQDRPFAMTPGFVTSTSPLQVQIGGAATPSYVTQLGGGTLSVGDKVFCFQVPMGSQSFTCVLAVN